MAQEEQSERSIVISVDGSDHSNYALDWYFQHIRRPNDRLILVHIPETYDYSLTSQSLFEELKADVERRVKALEQKCEEKLVGQNVKNAKFRTIAGKAGEKIVEVAQEENAALVITGTRGLGKIRRTFLGSVSDYVVHHCHCPVLVCRNK